MLYTRNTDDMDLIVACEALSDAPVIEETHAWFIGYARNAAVLELRLGALVPNAARIVRTGSVVAWASRRHSATIVYWPHEGTFELTLDPDLDQAISTIVNDIVPLAATMRPDASANHNPVDDDPRPERYGHAVSEPVITRVVAIEDLPPGSPATRRVIAEWSDGSQSDALAWFRDEWLVSEGDLVGLTRQEVRALARRRDRDWLRDDPPGAGDHQPFFGH